MINDIKLTDNFNLKEFECRCCKQVKIDSELVFILQRLRDTINRPVIVTSGYRCVRHNKEVGGVENSYHLQGLAVDIAVDMNLERLANLARFIGFRGIGIYRNFLHLDLGPVRTWRG